MTDRNSRSLRLTALYFQSIIHLPRKCLTIFGVQLLGNYCSDIINTTSSIKCNFSTFPLNRKIGLEKLLSRNIKLIEVSVAEAPNQSATYRAPVPQNEEELTFAEQLKFAPKPCFQEE